MWKRICNFLANYTISDACKVDSYFINVNHFNNFVYTICTNLWVQYIILVSYLIYINR